MDIITLDFETYFDSDYSLTKLTTEEYVRDPRFEALGLGVRFADGAQQWFPDPEEFLHHMRDSGEDNDFAVLCHHAHFDGLILSHHYGVTPRYWLDTLSMGRVVMGNHLRLGLGALAEHFSLAAKNVPYDLFRGKHWHELDPIAQRQVADGCLHDLELTWQLFQLMAERFPAEEYPVIDMTVRMFTEPCLIGDTELLGRVWMAEQARKGALLADLGVTEDDLQSADRFAGLLRDNGHEPEQKPGKNGPIYAFAKSDPQMKGLVDSDDPVLAGLALARLGVKSTIDQTRAERMGWTATRGPLPIYLTYAGAHTRRWSGGDKSNYQNLRRDSDLRKAIQAPPGYVLAVGDLSQIECRVLNYLAGQWDVIERFRNGEDPYIGTASLAYGRPITKTDKLERGTGKMLELVPGYGAGAETIQKTARLGTYGPPVIIDLAKATEWRDLYRSTHPQVVAYWRQATRMIARLAGGPPIEWGPLLVKDGLVIAPNGLWIDYTSMEYHAEWESWRVKTRNGWVKTYGGKLTQNVVELVSRVILSQAMLRLRRLGFRIVTCTHDEVVTLVKQDGNEYAALEIVLAELRRTPDWLPGIPLDAEGVVSERYAK